MAGLSKVWIGKESHPLADVEDLPDDETLEHYRAEAEIVAGGLNHDLIVQAGIEKVAAAARVDEITLVDAVLTQKALPEDVIARIKAAIVINPDASIEIVAVPKTRQETAMDRVYREQGRHIRELEKFIHAAGWTGFTHEQILCDLVDVGGPKVDPRFLTLAEIETFAKQFYGFTERLERKLAKDQRQAALFAKTARQARTRRDKSRTKRRGAEIERVAEFWGMPEIMGAKSVKHAHLIDKDLTRIAETGAEPMEIIFSPYLSKLNGSSQG